MAHRLTAKNYLTQTVRRPGSTSIVIPSFEEEVEAAARAAAFLSLIVNPEDASWLIRPLAFRGIQVKATRRGYSGYVKAIEPGGEYVVYSTRGRGALDVCSELYNAFSNQRVWLGDKYPLKY